MVEAHSARNLARGGIPMNPSMRSKTLLLCLGFVWAASAQAAEPGWYFVGFGGESSAAGVSLTEMDDNFVAVGESVGLEVLDLNSTFDDSDTGFGLTGGYQVNDHFALEFSYVDLGSVDYQATATLANQVETFDAIVGLETSASGPVLSALGILPIGERFSLFGRVGFSLLNADGSVRITIEGSSDRATQSSQKSDPVYGVGAEFALSKYFAIRVAWDRYMDVGTDDVTGDIDADLINLGVRMGVGWFR
jgi:OmpA-OmpF porin, OOP family